MKRREFVQSAGCVSCLLVAGGALSLLEACGTPVKAYMTVPKDKKDIGIPLTAFDKKNWLLIDREDAKPVFVIRNDSGQYRALSMRCTHKGFTLNVKGDHFHCDSHGSEFDFSGKVTHGPAKENLLSYDTRTEGNNIIVMIREITG